ncbi:alpha/beta hydrolase [Corynebacterium kozikiae]|uniref:alpha/beta hydrolase n=1 Tax=Corynebacterium kozikiae TaxID=2968469 RepID=UPI00211BA7D6|nr:alpha/beta hydrolase family protein [Corynebacterium sp. 76QC2CO]MCQ9342702.1 esterase family protein [Corynebacterium sp. 76QC2CO]
MKLLRRTAAPLAALAIAASTLFAPSAEAATLTPAAVNGGVPVATVTQGAKPGTELHWRDKIANNPRAVEMWAYSPSMNRDVPLAVLKASNPGRPTIYMLNGGDGGEGAANWLAQTDIFEFYADKDVNVVIPMAGKFSYYTDWVQENANLGGKQMWETFLVKELPGPLEATLQASNKRAIAGMSMSATTSLLLPEHYPGFYDAAASFSGCAATNSPMEREFVRITLQRGGAHPDQMWGPIGSPTALYNDALINADKLRGTALYVSNASGTPGVYDNLANPRLAHANPLVGSITVANVQVQGGAIEAATNFCTHNLRAKLDSLGIPADWNFRPSGTHSWGYWQDDLRGSWATFNRALNS